MGRTLRQRSKLRSTKNAKCLHDDPSIITLLKTLTFFNWNNETKLELRNFSVTGRGVCSRGFLNHDEILIRIPLKCMISPCSFTSDTFKYLKKDVKLSLQTLMALFLCVEKHKAIKSRWKFYLDSLPSRNPLTWLQLTPTEVANLPAHVSLKMEKFLTRFEYCWSSVVETINTECKCICCNMNYLHGVITKDLFAWCYAMINTRSVYIDPEFVRQQCVGESLDLILDKPNLALCPFLDMFNHSTEAQTTSDIIKYKGEYFYALRTSKNHRKLEQIFISYGPHDNVKLFVEYGFFLPQNRFDVWPIHFEELCKHLKFNEKKYEYLKNKHFDRDLYVSRTCLLSYNLKAAIFISVHCFKDFKRIYSDDYTAEEMDLFETFVIARLLDVRLTLTPRVFSDNMTNIFFEYLINIPINIVRQFSLIHANTILSE